MNLAGIYFKKITVGTKNGHEYSYDGYINEEKVNGYDYIEIFDSTGPKNRFWKLAIKKLELEV